MCFVCYNCDLMVLLMAEVGGPEAAGVMEGFIDRGRWERETGCVLIGLGLRTDTSFKHAARVK